MGLAEEVGMRNDSNMVAGPGSVPRMGDDANKIEHDQVHTQNYLEEIMGKLKRLEVMMMEMLKTNLPAMPAQRLKRTECIKEDDHVAEDLKKPWEQVSAEMAASKGEMVGGYVRNWRADKGFGFVNVRGQDVFAHITALRSSEVGIIGKRIVAKIIADKARGERSYRALQIYTEHMTTRRRSRWRPLRRLLWNQ